MSYLSWAEQTITDFSEQNIDEQYAKGFVFTRLSKGLMNQNRSLRVNLSVFEPSSENRRILKKTEGLKLANETIPFTDYSWTIGKLGKDFYETKFGEGTFSANKIKELLTDKEKSNFNHVLVFKHEDVEKIGYCITAETSDLLHYCYPFYKLDTTMPNLGLGMMLQAITLAKAEGKKYVYLGSFQRPTDTYKLQFAGLEWFNGTKWQKDLELLKTQLS